MIFTDVRIPATAESREGLIRSNYRNTACIKNNRFQLTVMISVMPL